MLSRRLPSSLRVALVLLLVSAGAQTPLLKGNTHVLSALPQTLYTTACATGTEFCLPTDSTIVITANGSELKPVGDCGERTFARLSPVLAFDGLADGPYEVIWNVKPAVFRARLSSRPALLQFLQEKTPKAGWRLGPGGNYISLPSETFGDLTIYDAGTSAHTTTTFSTVSLSIDETYQLPVGEYRLIATSPDGSDTTTLQIRCVPTESRSVKIVAGLRGSHCLTGRAADDTYDLAVLEAPDPRLLGKLEILGLCIGFEGRATGKTTGRFERCHTPTGNCERFDVAFEVVGSGETPLPQDDYAALAFNGQDMIEVTLNDDLRGTLTSLVISAEPDGVARVDNKYRIHYTAPLDWCGNDSLQYIVCTDGGCDEAKVKIQVTCEKLVVFTGFSPNGDGVNDHFTIMGIENQPDNQLVVFNEHGQQVFEKTGYANDWAGQSRGSHLADGTYYYVLTGSGFRMMSGYVQLQR